jgi:hypothetical protein
LRAIEYLIGQKVPIDPEQSLPEPAEVKSAGSSHHRRDPGSKRSNFKRFGAKRPGAKNGGPKGPGNHRKAEAAGVAGASKPKRRPGRKPKKSGQHAAQTT